ncbi:hypothetical protein LR48_Vigan03g131700 [Vigna angularis]|uniref:Uncharacterized protein n=1 Tax=Phaseolus angularis TaxID=3914 RepID=A0A0L9U570_PHAAN|nr:hypothetical protein LR48_Vigan03g131700 [Vigna angularis]
MVKVLTRPSMIDHGLSCMVNGKILIPFLTILMFKDCLNSNDFYYAGLFHLGLLPRPSHRSIKQQFLNPWPTWGAIPDEDKKPFWQHFQVLKGLGMVLLQRDGPQVWKWLQDQPCHREGLLEDHWKEPPCGPWRPHHGDEEDPRVPHWSSPIWSSHQLGHARVQDA